MIGHVDDKLRALIPISIAASANDASTEVLAWVDTAFNGSLVIPRAKVQELGLVQESSAEAVLADGNTVDLETYVCFVKWLGSTYETQIVVNDSEFPLLGTMLLAGRRLALHPVPNLTDETTTPPQAQPAAVRLQVRRPRPIFRRVRRPANRPSCARRDGSHGFRPCPDR